MTDLDELERVAKADGVIYYEPEGRTLLASLRDTRVLLREAMTALEYADRNPEFGIHPDFIARIRAAPEMKT